MSQLELGRVDLTDPANFRDGPPHEFLARLRADAPIWWHPDGLRRNGFWVVTRYEDVRSILLQPSVFVNAQGITIEPGEPAGLGDSEQERGQGALSYTDPPQHGPLRKVLAQHFTPARIRALGPLVREHANRLVGRLADAGGGDFITEVVDPYPLRVLAAVLGLPAETEEALHRYVGALGEVKSDGSASDDRARQAATIDFLGAVRELASMRGAHPGPDLISAMVTGSSEGAGLAAERIGGILIQLAIAGNETTRGGGGLGMKVLLENPAQWAVLTAEPARVPAAVEEILRLWPPVQYTRRTAAIEAELSTREHASTCEPGDTVYLSIASANRDPEVFEDADTFDIERAAGARSHLALGVGAHFCLGAALARLELGSLFSAVAELAPAITLAGPAVPGRGNQFIHSLARLPVSI
jgi:cholest-4-en-3-one 26-monooxygenase